MSYKLGYIAEFLEAELISASNLSDRDKSALLEIEINRIASLSDAEPDEISFVTSKVYSKDLAATRAPVVILTKQLVQECPTPGLLVKDAYLAYAKLTELFAEPTAEPGIHDSAVIAESSKVSAGASIGPNVVIGENVELAEGVIVSAGVVIGARAKVGERSFFYPNVTVYHDVQIGSDCVLHSGCVIGSDGFGFAPSPEGYVKIHQLGSVIIGDRVEVGSNTSIDRGALADTEIHDGAKIDNLVHIAHNCVIGENTALAGQVGMAGSTTIGKNCTFGGQVGIAGHIEIGDNVHALGKARLTKSISESGVYSSGTGFSDLKSWRKNAVRFNQLDEIYKRIQALEKKINEED